MDSRSYALVAAILIALCVLVEAFTGWPLGDAFWMYGSASTFLLYALAGLTAFLMFVLMDRLGRSRR